MSYSEIPIEKRWKALCEICRSFYFSWRELIAREIRDKLADFIMKFWEDQGHKTAEYYLRKGISKDRAAIDVAYLIRDSSLIMGEEVVVEEGPKIVVRHVHCPWYKWHKQFGIVNECRKMCDKWFDTVMGDIRRALGINLRFETIKSMPDGDAVCERQIWLE